MKVYIVSNSDDMSDLEPAKVFSSREKALEYMNREFNYENDPKFNPEEDSGWDITEKELDPVF